MPVLSIICSVYPLFPSVIPFSISKLSKYYLEMIINYFHAINMLSCCNRYDYSDFSVFNFLTINLLFNQSMQWCPVSLRRGNTPRKMYESKLRFGV